MILTALLLLSEILVGYTLVKWTKTNVSTIEKLLYSIVSGFMIGSWIIFILNLFLGLTVITLIVAIAIMLLGSRNTVEKLRKYKIKLPTLLYLKMSLQKYRYLIIFFIFLFFIFYYLYTKNLDLRADGLYTARINIGDLPGHLSIINSFLENSNPTLEYPDYAYFPLIYHFMTDFGTATIVAGGMSILNAMIFVGILFSLILFLLFFYLANQITKNKNSALLATVLFVFLGGLGFIHFFLGNQTYPYQDYTFYTEVGLYILNFITLLIPQRNFLIAFGAVFIILTILWRVSTKNANKRELAFAGLLAGLLPLFHAYLFLEIGIISFTLLLLNIYDRKSRWKKMKIWFPYFLLIITLSLPQVLWILQPVTDKLNVIRLQPGWVAKDNLLLFWPYNLGFLFILLFPAFYYAKKELKLFYLPFVIVFLIANTIIFQQWDVDNLKFFYIWVAANSILIAPLIYKLFTKSTFYKLLSILIVVISISSGILSIFFQSMGTFMIYSNSQISLSEWVKENTQKDALFLQAPEDYTHFVASLAGRRILMGYGGHIWGRGIDHAKRVDAIRQMYTGNSGLLNDYGIDYVVIGSVERSTYNANETFFDRNFQLVKKDDQYKLYKVRI